MKPHRRLSCRQLTRHAEFSSATGIRVFFGDAYAPWQRGSIGNTNGLLRQYFPKKTDLSVHTTEELDRVVNELNDRPREALNWQTPAEIYRAASLAVIA